MDHAVGGGPWFRRYPDKGPVLSPGPTARPSAKTRRARAPTPRAQGTLTNICGGDDLQVCGDSSPARAQHTDPSLGAGSKRETQVRPLGWEGPQEEGMTTHKMVLPRRIP